MSISTKSTSRVFGNSIKYEQRVSTIHRGSPNTNVSVTIGNNLNNNHKNGAKTSLARPWPRTPSFFIKWEISYLLTQFASMEFLGSLTLSKASMMASSPKLTAKPI